MDAHYDELELQAGQLAAALVARAARAGVSLATAESCTAGLVASTIASVPGASEVLAGGAVTYCDRVKHELLGVSSEALARYTAVSEAVALEMAEGARKAFSVDLAVSLTGYAGPGGGTPEDSAGTVYIAVSGGGESACERCVFAGSRNLVRVQAAIRALELLCARLPNL